MNKTFITISVISILAVGALAFAHGTGGWGGGNMMGQMGGGGQQDQKFLDETADLRKELHNKKFEYFEEVRSNDSKPEMISKMEKDIFDIQQKIRDKSPRSTDGGYRGLGCW